MELFRELEEVKREIERLRSEAYHIRGDLSRGATCEEFAFDLAELEYWGDIKAYRDEGGRKYYLAEEVERALEAVRQELARLEHSLTSGKENILDLLRKRRLGRL